jgi:hypothetical protein
MKKLLTMVAVATVIAAPAFAKTKHHQASTDATAHYASQTPADQRAPAWPSFGDWVPPTASP